MPGHTFKIGQIVHYRPLNHRSEAPRGAYQVIRLLPRDSDGEPKYCIRNLDVHHERIAKQFELKPRPNDKL